MDDPTKDLIPRRAVEYCCRKETVSTNPDAYSSHEKFIQFMDDPEVAEFGRWMHSNGFNCALTTIQCDLDKIPSVPEPERKTGRWIGDCCSNCGVSKYNWFTVVSDQSSPFGTWKFCPNCGAKMEGVEQDVSDT